MAAERRRAGAARTDRHRDAPQRVRIIGGRYRRTPLPVLAAPDAGLRPTPDRVRETLFNWLAHLRPDFSGLRALDLFAGTGALGFECASRGAAQVTLIEREPRLAAQLEQVRDKLGASAVQVLRGDALALARTLPPAKFDLVFVDPPYGAALHAPALAAVLPLLAPGALVYVEGAAPLAPGALAALGLVQVRALRAGAVHAQLLSRTEPGAGDRPQLPPPADA